MVIFVDDGLPIKVEYKNGVYVAELPEAKAIKTAFHYLETHPEARGKLQVRKSEAIPYTSTEAEHFKPNLEFAITSNSKGIEKTTALLYVNYRFVLLDPEIKHNPQDLINEYGYFLSILPFNDGRRIQVKDLNVLAYNSIKKSLRTRATDMGIYSSEVLNGGKIPKIFCLYALNPTSTIRSIIGLQKHSADKNENKRMLPLSPLEDRLNFE